MAFPFAPVLDAFEDAIPPRNLSTYNAAVWQLAWQGVDLQTAAGGVARAVVANPGRNITNTVYNADQEAFVTIQTLPAAAQAVVLYLRGKSPTTAITNAATNFYEADYTAVAGAANDTVSLFKRIGGVSTQLNGGAAVATRELVAGDQFGFAVAGSTLTVYANGVSVGSLYDQALTGTGVIGVGIDTANSAARIDNFGGGNSTAIAPFASVRAFQEAADPRAFQDSAFQRPDPTDAFITAQHAFFQENAFQRPDPVQAFQDGAFDDEAFQEAADAFADQAFQGDSFQQDERPASATPAGVTGVGQIPSAAAFGTTQVQRQLRQDGTGIPTGEAFGTTKLQRQLANAGAISTGEALGQPKLFPQVNPVGIASGAAVGTPRLLVITKAGGISTGQLFGVTAVQRQVREDGTGIASGVAFGRPAVGNFNPSVTGAGQIPSGEAFGVTKLFIRVGPTGVVSTAAFGTTAVQRQVREDGTGIASQAAVGKPFVGHQIGAAGIPTGEQVGTPRTIRPTQVGGISTGVAFGRPTVTIPPQPVPVTLGGGHRADIGPAREPRYILDQQQRDHPVARPNPKPVTAAGIVTAEAFGTPTLALLAPPQPPTDVLAREEEELLGILELVA